MQLSKVVQSQRDFFQTNETKSIDFRKSSYVGCQRPFMNICRRFTRLCKRI